MKTDSILGDRPVGLPTFTICIEAYETEEENFQISYTALIKSRQRVGYTKLEKQDVDKYLERIVSKAWQKLMNSDEDAPL